MIVRRKARRDERALAALVLAGASGALIVGCTLALLCGVGL